MYPMVRYFKIFFFSSGCFVVWLVMLATVDQCWLYQEVVVDQVVFSGWVLLTIFFSYLE